MINYKEIDFSQIKGISIGNDTDTEGKTGVTVFYFPQAAIGAVNVLGGGPASRETHVLDPERNGTPLNALVFAGGSAFGLEAAHGVMECLESAGIGYDTGSARIPIVCQSNIFDLGYGRSDIRPDKAMGYRACANALKSNKPVSGNAGVGTGATVGKAHGLNQAQKSGIGYAAAQLGELIVGVAAVVNAFGDIFYEGRKIAGLTNKERTEFEDSTIALYQMQPRNLFTGNTTVAAVFTNGNFTQSELKKISSLAAAGLFRSISPAATSADGDTIYAISVGGEKVTSTTDVAGVLAARMMELAIYDAVSSSKISEEEYLGNIIQ